MKQVPDATFFTNSLRESVNRNVVASQDISEASRSRAWSFDGQKETASHENRPGKLSADDINRRGFKNGESKGQKVPEINSQLSNSTLASIVEKRKKLLAQDKTRRISLPPLPPSLSGNPSGTTPGLYSRNSTTTTIISESEPDRNSRNPSSHSDAPSNGQGRPPFGRLLAAVLSRK